MRTAAVILPLALTGCNTRTAQQQNAPADRVAGERQELDPQVAQAMQAANLPVSFFFGGRVWRGHQLHRVSPEDAGGAAGTNAPADTTPGAADAAGVDGQIGDYVPMANMTVQGHQIYRRGGLDEAVTDNIYLRAGAAGTETTGDTGATGDTAAAQPGELLFIEYDAADEPLTDLDLQRILTATNLPSNVSWNGRTWQPAEMQVYDPDVFDDLRPVPQSIDGHTGFRREGEDDRVYLMAEFSPSAMATTPGQPGDAAAGDAGVAPEIASGPVFVRYEAAQAEGAGTPR
jgi:hypothetical protein